MTTKLLYVVRPAAGGMAGHIQTLCAGLDPAVYSITLACPTAPPDLPMGMQVLPLPVADRIAPAQDWQVFRTLRRLIRSRSYDLVHAHGLKAALLTALACRNKHAPPLVITLHNSLPGRRTGIGGKLVDTVLRRILQTAKRIIVVSHAQEKEILARRLIKAEQLVVIHNGIVAKPPTLDKRITPNQNLTPSDVSSHVRSELGIAADSCMVLMVGRIISAKGIGDLLVAARILKEKTNCHFVIAGDGPDLPRFMNEAESTGLATRVWFLGHRFDIPDLLQAADIFVLPSHSEGLPLSILEAMAAARAVVATLVGGIPELVEHEVNGLLVPPNQPRQLVEAIYRLVQRPEVRIAYGQAGRRLFDERFSAQEMLSKLSTVYDSVLFTR